MNMNTKNRAKSPLGDLNGQLMIMAAHRYCLGRESFIVNSCIEWLREWWFQFEKNTKEIIIRDTIAALMDRDAGSPTIDEPEWKRFAKWGFEQLDKEGREACIRSVAHKEKPWPI